MLSVILFLIVLSILVFVHEAGHFLAAKAFGIRVDEFGLGYPPRAKKLFRWKGTDFTLNWLPFGGFVKIFGEDADETVQDGASAPADSFISKPRLVQAFVLVAGVIGNFVFAWILISGGFMSGLPAPDGLDLPVQNSQTVITEVVPGSPAEAAGLKSGDKLVSLSRGSSAADVSTPGAAADFIGSSAAPLSVTIDRGDKTLTETVVPKAGIVGDKPGIGVAMQEVGLVKFGFFRSVYEGFRATVVLTKETAQALWAFISQAVVGHANLSEVTGPVGLVGMVGDASALGFVYLVSFVALISINLSIVNLLPFPALDGGRLLFVIIEAIRRKPISPRVANTLNTVGFGLLLLLMLLITVRDVHNLL